MASINLQIPDAVISRVINAICAQQGYQAELVAEDGTTSSNPQTKAQFAKQFIIRVVMENVKRHEANLAAAQITEQTLRTGAIDKVEAEVNIT